MPSAIKGSHNARHYKLPKIRRIWKICTNDYRFQDVNDDIETLWSASVNYWSLRDKTCNNNLHGLRMRVIWNARASAKSFKKREQLLNNLVIANVWCYCCEKIMCYFLWQLFFLFYFFCWWHSLRQIIIFWINLLIFVFILQVRFKEFWNIWKTMFWHFGYLLYNKT